MLHGGRQVIDRANHEALVALIQNMTLLPMKAKWMIHVAGTSGKGTVSMGLYRSLLHSYGDILSVGVFTSPHLCHPRDCVFPLPSLSKWASVCKLIQDGDPDNKCTQFEHLCIAARILLTECDIIIIECGLGGKNDATTTVFSDVPNRIACLTTIGRDHLDQLGPTMENLVLEKVAISEKAAALIVGAQRFQNVHHLINSHALTRIVTTNRWTSVSGPLCDQGRPCQWIQRQDGKIFPLFLLGSTARDNLATVSACLTTLSNLDAPLFSRSVDWVLSVSEAMLPVHLPGRYQFIESSFGRWILDGAHHIDAAHALSVVVASLGTKWCLGEDKGTVFPLECQAIFYDDFDNEQCDSNFSAFLAAIPRCPVHWIVAMGQSRDPATFFKALNVRSFDCVTLTTYATPEGMPWARCRPLDESNWPLKYFQSLGVRVNTISDPIDALKSAFNDSYHGAVVVTGSLYLVSEMARHFQEVAPYHQNEI